MVEHQSHPKKMENLNIIIEINEEGEMADFDISLRNELPYKNTDEYEYVVEEFEKVKEVNHKKLRCLLARELNCFACSAIYRFQLVFVRRRRRTPQIKNVQYVVVDQRTNKIGTPTIQRTPQQVVTSGTTTKTVRVIPKVVTTQAAPKIIQMPQRVVAINNESARIQVSSPQERKLPLVSSSGRAIKMPLKLSPTKTITISQNSVVRGRQAAPSTVVQRKQVVEQDVGSGEEYIEMEMIESVEVDNSSAPQAKRQKTMVKASPGAVKAEPKPEPKEKGESTEDENLKCDLCNKEFHSARQRQRHRIQHLEKNNVLNCKKCDKAFLEKTELLAHERSHARGSQDSAAGGKKTPKRKSEVEEVLMEMTVADEEEVIQDAGEGGMQIAEVV